MLLCIWLPSQLSRKQVTETHLPVLHQLVCIVHPGLGHGPLWELKKAPAALLSLMDIVIQSPTRKTSWAGPGNHEGASPKEAEQEANEESEGDSSQRQG